MILETIGQISLLDSALYHLIKWKNLLPVHAMPRIPKTELSPDNGCVIDMKWQLGPLSYHASRREEPVPLMTQSTRLRKSCFTITLDQRRLRPAPTWSFHYVGDFWNDRISCLIVVNGVVAFYRDRLLQGTLAGPGPGYYESFFAEKGPDDVGSARFSALR